MYLESPPPENGLVHEKHHITVIKVESFMTDEKMSQMSWWIIHKARELHESVWSSQFDLRR